jgi:WD40 repeat protein
MQRQVGSAGWGKVYIFVSSTFNDMHAERDYLVKKVFPQLAEWCERRKLHMLDIDLRWGVTEVDATGNKNVVRVCLNRIDECRPFFICLLGQRYGRIFGRADISEETFADFPGLEAAVQRGASITELEVRHALISPFHSPETIETRHYHPAKHSFFYSRDEGCLEELPPEPRYLRRIYDDAEEADEAVRQELVMKREALMQAVADSRRPCHRYEAGWRAGQRTPEIALPLRCPASLETNQEKWRADWLKAAGVRVGGLDVGAEPSQAARARGFNDRLTAGRLADFHCEGRELGDVILDELKGAIAACYPGHREVEYRDELQREMDQQEQFVFMNREGFIRRPGDFADLDGYAGDDSTGLFVLTAEPGMGKSMLLANWLEHYRRETRHKPDHSLHFRFIGASDGSTTVYSLLRWLLREIKESGKLEAEIPQDPKELRGVWPKLLEEIGKRGKTVIVIDALNQLETGLSDLWWLPRQLPGRLKLLVSFKRGDEGAEELYNSFASDRRVRLAAVAPFDDRQDRRKLIQAYLLQYLKELDERHMEALAEAQAAFNPLYLKVVLSELRIYGDYSGLGAKIQQDFGQEPLSAFQAVLARLEEESVGSPLPAGPAVSLIFGLLAHCRSGLTGDELIDLVTRVLGSKEKPVEREAAADTVYFYLRQVRPFLARRQGRYDFFYESFQAAVKERYVSKGPGETPLKRSEEEWHRLLADYFYDQPTWQEPGESRQVPGGRKVAELPYHLTCAGDWRRLEETLCDLDFIEAKCTAGWVYELVADYDRLGIDRRAYGTPIRTAWRHQDLYGVYCPFCRRWCRIEATHLGEILPCSHCGQELKINSFFLEGTWPVGGGQAGAAESRQLPQPAQPVLSPEFYDYSRFVKSHAHILNAFPRLTFQQAANLPDSLTPAQSAKSRWESAKERRPWVQWLNKRTHPDPCILTLKGHTRPVVACAFSPDGRWLVSGGADNTLKLWDALMGTELASIDGPFETIRACSFSPDGRRILCALENKTLQIWDVETRRRHLTLTGHGEGVVDCAYSPDGRRIISAGAWDKTVKIWDAETGFALASLQHADGIYDCAYSPDGRRIIAAGSWVGEVRIWDARTGKAVAVLPDHDQLDLYCAYSPDASRIVTCSKSKVRLWEAATARLTHTLTLSEYLSQCSFSPDGRYILWDTTANTIQIFDVEKLKVVATLFGHGDCINMCTFSPDGRRIASVSKDATLKVWDVGLALKGSKKGVDATPVYVCAYSADGKRVVSGNEEGRLRIWDAGSGKELPARSRHKDYVKTLTFSDDGRRLVSGSADNTLKTWDVDAGLIPLKTLQGHSDTITMAAISPDSGQVVSGAADGTIRLWQAESGKALALLEEDVGEMAVCAYSPDGQLIATSRKAHYPAATPRGVGTLRLWDAAAFRQVGSLAGHSGTLFDCAFSPDGCLVLTASVDRALKLWDIGQRVEIATLSENGFSGGGCLFSADGRRVMAVSGDTTIRCWDIRKGTELFSLDKHSRFRGFSPQGRWVLMHPLLRVVPTLLKVTDIRPSAGTPGHPSADRTIQTTFSEYEKQFLRLWDVERQSYPVTFAAASPIGALTVDDSWQGLAAADDFGTMYILKVMGLEMRPGRVTIGRLYLHTQGRWEECLKARCSWCRNRFSPPPKVLDGIKRIAQTARLSPPDSPCLKLPDEAWAEPILISPCPLCRKPLHFNPFITDHKDRLSKS